MHVHHLLLQMLNERATQMDKRSLDIVFRKWPVRAANRFEIASTPMSAILSQRRTTASGKEFNPVKRKPFLGSTRIGLKSLHTLLCLKVE